MIYRSLKLHVCGMVRPKRLYFERKCLTFIIIRATESFCDKTWSPFTTLNIYIVTKQVVLIIHPDIDIYYAINLHYLKDCVCKSTNCSWILYLLLSSSQDERITTSWEGKAIESSFSSLPYNYPICTRND